VTREGISDSDLKVAEGKFPKLALWDLIKLQVEAPQAEGYLAWGLIKAALYTFTLDNTILVKELSPISCVWEQFMQ